MTITNNLYSPHLDQHMHCTWRLVVREIYKSNKIQLTKGSEQNLINIIIKTNTIIINNNNSLIIAQREINI